MPDCQCGHLHLHHGPIWIGVRCWYVSQETGKPCQCAGYKPKK